VRALADVVLRRPRSRYRASGTARAPIEAVWELSMRRDVTFAAAGLRMLSEPVVGQDGVILARIFRGERELPGIAYRYERQAPPTVSSVRYLREESPPGSAVGIDDIVTVTLSSEQADRTRITYTRELTHVSFATRISAPMGLRSAVSLTSAQAEHEAGHAAPRAPLWHQLVWTVLAFLSFAWLLDWRFALALMAIIAVHELGHALFMLRYGLGIHFVSFVPFLGGVAAPKRYYETEWQRGIIALMGVGFSLPISLALIAIAAQTDSPNLGAVAVLAVVINAVNLIPFPALDGSIVVSMLLGKLHRNLNLAVTVLMFGLFVATGIIMRHPLVWAAIALSFISVVQVMSLRADDHLVKMRPAASFAMLGLYLALLVGHGFALYWASMTTARAETNLLTACIKANGTSPASLRACRDANRLWLVPET
jgi:Zn-dependent protease